MRLSHEMLKSRDARFEEEPLVARRGTKPLRPGIDSRPGHLQQSGQLRHGQLVVVEEVREPFGEPVSAEGPAECHHLTLLWAGSEPLAEPRPCRPGAAVRWKPCHAAQRGAAAAGTWGLAAAEE